MKDKLFPSTVPYQHATRPILRYSHLPPDELAADHDGRLDGVRVHRLRRVAQTHMPSQQPPTLNLLKSVGNSTAKRIVTWKNRYATKGRYMILVCSCATARSGNVLNCRQRKTRTRRLKRKENSPEEKLFTSKRQKREEEIVCGLESGKASDRKWKLQLYTQNFNFRSH